MKRRAMLFIAASVLVGIETQAQISSVTRRTIQSPTPLSLFAPASPPVQPQVTTYVTVRPAPPLKTEDSGEKLRRTIAFQKQRAEAGSPTFQYDLALRYLTGDGVERNPSQARHWLAKAKEQGHERANSKLAELEKAEKTP